MSIRYTVDSFHISVGAGDAAVHLLLQQSFPDGAPPEFNRNKGGHVIAASWIDGGPPTYGPTAVLNTFRHIEARYTFPPDKVANTPLFKLDSVVITHWDEDHYGGVGSWVIQDIRLKLFTAMEKANPRSKGEVIAAWNAALSDPGIKFTYGRYDERGNPQTMLLTPYWYKKDSQTIDVKSQNGKCASGHAYWILEDKDTKTAGIGISGTWTDAAVGLYELPLSGYKCGVFKLEYGPDRVIGQDLFSPLTTTLMIPKALSVSYTTINDKEALLDSSNRWNIPVTRPGLYCVGADSRVVGDGKFLTDKETITDAPVASKEPISLREKFRPPPIDVVDKNASGSNRSSIIALLIWDPAGTPKGWPQILHYTAGDAEWEEEDMITGWTQANGEPDRRVPVMKLSHHGSKTSTPTKLLDVFQSDWVIVSAGTMHKHPTWPVLAYLDAVLDSQRVKQRNGQNVYVPDKPFLPMGWPYWMLRIPNNDLKEEFNIDILGKIPNPADPFLTRLLEIETAGAGTFFNTFATAYGGLSSDGQKDRLVTQLETQMDHHLSIIKRAHNVYPGETRIIDKRNTYTDNDILYHLISIRAGEKPTHAIGTPKTIPAIVPCPPPTTPSTGGKGGWGTAVREKNKKKLRFAMMGVIRRKLRSVDIFTYTATAEVQKYIRGRRGKGFLIDFLEKHDGLGDLPPIIPLPQDPIDPNFYILSTEWGVGPSSDPKVTILTADPDLDNFVAGLESASLALQSTPVAPPETGLGIALSDGDYWRYWMQTNHFQATDVYVQAVQTAPQQYSVQGFAVTLALVPPLTPAATPYKLTYTSSAAQEAFTFDNLPLLSIPTTGIISDFAMLIMGVDSSSPDLTRTMNIVDLMQIFGIDQGIFGLAEDLQLVIDTTPGSRNAIWYTPSYMQATYLRLQFTVKNISSLQDILDDVFQKGTVEIKDPFIVLKINSNLSELGNNSDDDTLPAFSVHNESELILGATFTTSPTFSFSVFFDYVQAESMSITLTLNGDADLGALLTELERVLVNAISAATGGIVLPNLADWLDAVGASTLLKAADAIKFRQIVLTVTQSYNTDGTPGRRLVASVQVTFEVGMNIGQDSGSDKNVVFLLTFNWPSENFIGNLFFDIEPQADIFPQLLTPEQEYSMPWYEEYRMLRPITENLAPSLKITQLIPLPGISIPDPPNFIPNDIEQLSLEFGKDSGGNLYASFSATVVCITDDNNNYTVPPLAIEYILVSLSHNWGTSVTTFELAANLTLDPRKPADSAIPALPEASLTIDVSYDTDQDWQLTGAIQDLTLGHLYGVCEPAYSDAMMDILETIGIKTMSVLYKFGGGIANYFMFQGQILLGALELDFYYESNAGQWTFDAYLGATSPNTKLFDLIDDICGSGITDLLPPAANIPITVPTYSTKDFVTLHVKKHEGGQEDGDGTLAFSLTVNFGGGKTLTFVQLQTKSASNLRSMENGASAPPPKRVVRFELGGTPDASNIPLVGKIPQSYDAMEFLWVGGGSPSGAGGLTRGEVTLINDEVLKDSNAQILFQDLTKTDPVDNTQLVLPNGCHFIIVLNGNVILDYLFNQPKPPTLSSAIVLSGDRRTVSRVADGDDDGDAGDTEQTTMAPMKKSFGPFTISNIGLRYHDETIWVMMDATVMLGPIEFELQQFGIGIKVSGLTLDNLIHVPDIDFTISGLGVEFDEPPITVAGLFLTKNDFYMGGVTVGFDPYTIMAVGAYGTAKNAAGDQFKTAFIYGEVEGPLVSIEVAEVTDVKLGFGYNSAIKNPDFNTISNFPFTTQAASVPGAQNDPLSLMTKFCTPDPITGILWILPTNGSLWLAAGLVVLAFEVINVSAIVVIEFNPAVSLSVFADAVASMPLDADSPSDAFMYIEFAMIATCDFSHGTFIDQAQLTPKSFVLSPSCHLSGGYAMASWFGPSSYAGEWVVSIGGYHPAYTPASYYPVPPRLAISWNLDNCISISGDAYFAATPKSCMGGGNLNATFSAGPLGAHFSAWADFLINYHPFYFTGSVGVSVGVEFTLDLWICTIHISVDIGASLSLHGPPFQGVVHVDFWVFGFDINFGSGSLPQAVDWPAFWLMLCQVNAQDPSGTTTNGPNTQLIHALQTGAVPSQGQIQTKRLTTVDPWLVRAGSFSFEVQSRMPLTYAAVNKANPATKSELFAKDKTTDDIYNKPMQKSDKFTSELSITIDGVPDPFRLTATMKQLPKAIWGAYDSKTDPTTSQDGNYVPTLLTADKPSSLLMTGLVITAPKPIKGSDTIPTFNAVIANQFDVNHPEPDESLAQTPAPQGGEFVPSPTWPPASGEVIRTTWITGGTAMPAPAAEALEMQPKDAPPPVPIAESFSTQWQTLFGFPLTDVLDLKTSQVTQHPLVSAPPQSALLKDQPGWEGYFIVEPRLGAASAESLVTVF